MNADLKTSWNLLATENPHSLTDEQITKILTAKKDLLALARRAEGRLCEGLEELQKISCPED